MPKLKNPIRRLLDRLQNRFARSRPGSVLVLVVALLVLMALIGTAYITTARTDRFSAQQNALNTQIDLLLQGVINMAEASMTTSAHQQAGQQHWDDTRSDPWLSARIPTKLEDAFGAYVPGNTYAKGDIVMVPYDFSIPPNNNSNTVYICTADGNATAPTAGMGWTSLGTYASVLANLATNKLPNVAWPGVSSPLAPNAMYEDPRFPLTPFPGHNSSQPGIIAVPTSLTFGGKSYPAFQFYDPASAVFTKPVIAASASGDGIADAFLWRLPIGEINGVTYYAATRIVDNNAAINLNTAMSSTVDFDYQGKALTSLASCNLSFGIFPSNIGLAEMLRTLTPTLSMSPASVTDQNMGQELINLNSYRCNFQYSNQPRPTGIINGSTAPIDDYGMNGTQRSDFKFNTLEEALYMGLGRRLANPGYITQGVRYQTFSWPDAMGLAYKFDLVNINATPTASENNLPQSLYINSRQRTWDPVSDIPLWFSTFQAQPPGTPTAQFPPTSNFSLRPFATTRNPLNNSLPVQDISKSTTSTMQHMMLPNGYSATTFPRVSLNTADVVSTDTGQKNPTLLYGFYNTMAGALNSPNLAVYQQFRSSLRMPPGVGGQTFLNPAQMVYLRSLIASIQAKDLRDSDDDVDSRRVEIPGVVINGVPSLTNVTVTVFGTERQPFITEVYANNDNSQQKTPNLDGSQNPNGGMTNPNGYVAVELFNPYDKAISLANWTLGILNRDPSATNGKYPGMRIIGIDQFTTFVAANGQTFIPPGGYLVLENYPNGKTAIGPKDATYRPIAAYKGVTAPTAVYYVPNLAQVLASDPADPDHPGGELVLLRPRRANGIPSASPPDYASLPQPDSPLTRPGYSETNLYDMVPADAFDFTGMKQPQAGSTTFTAWHYVRANDATNSPWKFVYPGRWDPVKNAPYFQEGIAFNSWNPSAQPPDPTEDKWISTPPSGAAPGNGAADKNTVPIQLGVADANSTYVNIFPAIQLNNKNFGGPNKLTNSEYAVNTANHFPYGGFARLGDVLQVPFIGAYTITVPSTDPTLKGAPAIIEMNSVTTDSAFADDNDNGADDAIEQIGRFCPLAAVDPKHLVPLANNIDRYAWAANVLDNFTVIANPHDDYLPNTDPINYLLWDTTNLTFATTPPSMIGTPANFYPSPVPNLPKQSASTANRGNEDLAPIEGLININTAPFEVLRRVPFTGAGAIVSNDVLAHAIIVYRNSNGPFKTLFDLNNVPGFQNAYGEPAGPTGVDYNLDAGDLSPGDHVLGDFEQRFMEMTRVSNLLTTRSDTYTAYILVQGWRGVGTANPELVVQRRAAFIADRSGVTANNRSLNVFNVQAN
ncbi:MAG: Helix-hairpin-helix motif containing protein [Phycisphaerales bacterium]|nr:Helix-hairpin-helix motif containing protein [Phycisphaerales bacterium]